MASWLGLRVPALGLGDQTAVLKWFSLLLLIFQSSTHALLIRYSKTLGASRYLPSSTVVVTEVLKFVVSAAMVVAYEVPPTHTRWGYVRMLLLDSAQSIVPAGLYAIQNNLVFIALANLDAATFQVMYQSKIITTALFAVTLLNKRLSITQWIALVLLVLGVVLVQTPSCEVQIAQALAGGPGALVTPAPHRNTLLGLLVIVVISLTSGFAGVYFEKIVKSSKSLSVFARNMQLALWGFAFSVLGMLWNDGGALAEDGLFQGYTATVWGIINISAFGGLLIAVVVKYTDNIAKGFATSISILLSTVVSAVFFDFSVDLIFFVGASVVIISVFLYSEPDKIYAVAAAAAPGPPQHPSALLSAAAGPPLTPPIDIRIASLSNAALAGASPTSPGLPLFHGVGAGTTTTTTKEALIALAAEAEAALCLHRAHDPFWLHAHVVRTAPVRLPDATLFALLRTRDGGFTALATRCGATLRGAIDVVVDGDADVAKLLVREDGRDAFTVVRAAARCIGTGNAPQRPPFADGLGWCTWDAFHERVTAARVLQGLTSLSAFGAPPAVLLLDDGWQHTASADDGPRMHRRLASFGADQRAFPDGLGAFLTRVRREHPTLRHVLVWHAVGGYWGGAAVTCAPDVIECERRMSPGPWTCAAAAWLSPTVGVVPAAGVAAFFDAYHAQLARDGVDGAKIDSQTALETLPLAGITPAYRAALAASMARYFSAGGVVHCMALSNALLYDAAGATACTRTSPDYVPAQPDSHGLHVFTNAAVSLWLGEVTSPDWDMFQTGHHAAHLHAVARVVGGSPVYVSDRPGEHDTDVLRRLALPDGGVLLADAHGRPTSDCLFVDPTVDATLYKIVNTVRRRRAALVGVFNLHSPGGPVLDGVLHAEADGRRADVWPPAEPSDRFVVFAHYRDEQRVLGPHDAWHLTLAAGHCELFTVVHAPPGAALVVVGIAGMYNSAATVLSVDPDGAITLHCGGQLVAWCAGKPHSVSLADGTALPFAWTPQSGRLQVFVPSSREPRRVHVVLA